MPQRKLRLKSRSGLAARKYLPGTMVWPCHCPQRKRIWPICFRSPRLMRQSPSEVQVMHLRHRIPVIFSLSMLDMLCCALGAVIFLMILNMWDARRQAKVLALERTKVGDTVQRLTESQSELEKTQTDVTSTQTKLRALEEEVEMTKSKLADAEKSLEAAKKTAVESDKARTDIGAEMATMQKHLEEQQALAKTARERLEEVEKDRSESAKAAALVPGLQKQLADAMKRAKALEDDLEQLRKQSD